jgi:putative ABC transport system permease protein
MRPEALLHLYWQRLKTHRAQELMAGAGIAIGVALVFAVIVANTSISSSASQIVHGIAGNATLQLDARDEHGFPSALLAGVRAAPSVEHAAGIMEQRAILAGTRERRAVVLVGVDASLVLLGGPLTQDFNAGNGLTLGDGLLMPRGVAERIGLPHARPGTDRSALLHLRGRTRRVPIAAVLGSDVIGALSNALVVVAPLDYVQRLSVLPARLSRIFVQPKPGQEAAARRDLATLAGGRITVASVNSESRILAQASAPADQSTSLFAAISAIVGFLLAFNAMLLTVPERRRAIAEFRSHGYTPRQIVLMVAFEALVLGAIASGIGLALGLLLARTFFSGVPTYLAFAFPLGAQQTVPASTIAVAFIGGLLATFVAAAQPLIDLLPSRAPDAVYHEGGEPGQALGLGARRVVAAGAVLLLLGATALVALIPSATVFAMAALAIGVLLALPAVLGLVIAMADRLAGPRPRLNMVVVAVMALRATRLRAIALAATGAVAVFGSVAIEGAHRDLVRGLHDNFAQYLNTTDLWITTGGDDLTTENFRADDALARIRRVPAVAAARPYFGSLLDIGERRAWVIARSAGARGMVPAGEIQAGSVERADELLRGPGNVAVSEKIAAAQNVGIGDKLALPTPTGTHHYRIVATLTNLGWGPGAVILNATDYRRAWATNDPTAFEVDLKPGAAPLAAKAAVQRAIGPDLALHVQTAAEREVQYNRLASEGLHRLTQISILLLVAAAIALTTATGAAIWQRRNAFADYRNQGFMPGQLWSALLIESGIVLATGCAVGALAGVYGQFLLGRWLRLTTGFPAPFEPSFVAAFATFGIVVLAALLFVAGPSYRAARSPIDSGLQN